VITLGDQGAVAVNEQHAWHIKAPRVQALCPVGSGDAVMGGLIAALNRGEPLSIAVQYGVALGTANVLKLGSGCFDLDALPILHKQTTITSIDKATSPSSEHAA
jgi:tagatose 6-phosphate kinase